MGPLTRETVRTEDVVKDAVFKCVTEARVDTKDRISLARVQPSGEVTFYRVYQNSLGQLILDPQITIPAHEAWLYKNAKALKMVKDGLRDIQEGRVVDATPEDLGEENE